MYHYYPGGLQWSVLDLEHARRQGTGRIADDLYLIAHRESNGKPYLSDRAVGIVLAGGLLAELLVALRPAIELENGYLFPKYNSNGEPVARYAPPDEPLTRKVLGLIVAESPPRPIRDWLLFLGEKAAAEIARRLEEAGYLICPPSRLPWRTPKPVPIEGYVAQCAVLRAHRALHVGEPQKPYPALLAALTLACGLGFRFSGLSNAPGRSAQELTRILPRPLQELTAHVQARTAAAVVSRT